MGKTNICVPSVTIKHLYISTEKSHEDYRFACSECDHKARKSTNSKKQNGAW